jgi:hypothetical protein
MQQLDSHGKTLERIAEKVTRIEVDVAGLKVKAGVWGLLGGAIPAVGTVLLLLWKSHAGIE